MMRSILRKTFTLIELLIVVAIIIILMSLIQPSLRRVIKQANKTLCINRLHQIYMGEFNYIDDHNDCIPSAIGWGANPNPVNAEAIGGVFNEMKGKRNWYVIYAS